MSQVRFNIFPSGSGKVELPYLYFFFFDEFGYPHPGFSSRKLKKSMHDLDDTRISPNTEESQAAQVWKERVQFLTMHFVWYSQHISFFCELHWAPWQQSAWLDSRKWKFPNEHPRNCPLNWKGGKCLWSQLPQWELCLAKLCLCECDIEKSEAQSQSYSVWSARGNDNNSGSSR